ncbi:MAG TPA: response regulator [Polyangiaceae bacterium]|jgi:DNA-binding response OmpR family regulator
MSWIAVVDDAPDVRDELAEAIRVAGYEVRTFADGLDALHWIGEAHELPLLVLLDVGLPYMSGLEVLRRLRERPRTASLPVVLLTGFDLDEEETSGKEATAVLRKPVVLDDLLARIGQLVGALH